MTAGQAVGVGGVITPAQYQGGGGGGGSGYPAEPVVTGTASAGQVLTANSATTASFQAPTGGPPSGAAGGDLSGTYPNPTVAESGGVPFGSAAFQPASAFASTVSPAFTGTPTSTTAAPGDTSTQIATDAFVAVAVNAAVQGLAVKPSVQEATTTALPANTYSNGASGVGATLTAVLPGVLTVDGIAVTLGSRVLVQDEAAAANNGIYVMTTLGTVSVAYVLTRAADMNQAAEVPGAFVFTEAGTVNGGAGFTVAGAGPYTIGTTAINWTQFSGAGEITTGTGLTKTGNVISLSVPVAIANGGTGQATPNAAPANFLPADPASTVSTSLVMMGLGATCSYTPTSSGKVLVTFTFGYYNLTAGGGIYLSAQYGTGAAPANGAALTGTLFGGNASKAYTASTSATNSRIGTFSAMLSLTAGTTYWFDIALGAQQSADAAVIQNVNMIAIELPA